MRSKRLVSIILLVIFGTGFVFFKRPKEDQVMALVSPVVDAQEVEQAEEEVLIASESAVVLPTLTPTLTATPTSKPILTPTPIPTPTLASSEEVNRYVDRYANQYGVDANVIRHVALCESGFRSNAVNHAYVGLFQFGENTWKNIRLQMGEEINPDLRFSAEESVATAAYVISKGKTNMWPNCVP